MHNNYFFLKQLTPALENRLRGTVVSECFSQNKDELILRLETHTEPFFLKAALTASFSCLCFPANFHRARRNSVDLFPDLIGRRVSHLVQYENERSFSLVFEEGWALLFKLHGNRANLLLFENDSLKDLFKKNMKGDQTLVPNTLHREIDWGYEYFAAHTPALKKHYFTFGKVVWQHLDDKGFASLPVDQQWTLLQQTLQQLNAGEFMITLLDDEPVFSLLPVGDIQARYTDPITALNEFFIRYVQTAAYGREKKQAVSLLRHRLDGTRTYIQKLEDSLLDTARQQAYKTSADVLMAHLHEVKPGMTSVTLPNFYDNNAPLEIKLKKDLTPQKNAEVFYRKAKNQAIEATFLEQAYDAKLKEADKLETALQQVTTAPDLATLRTMVQALNLKSTAQQQAEVLPYHEFEHKGYAIRIGKNAAANDELTLRHTYKEDLWLHAKDVAGSHVVIKHKAGRKIPGDVIERAAQVAAYNSKRKNESLCPVIVTPKKFVRKRKGDPPGAMVVEREEVLMVEPKGF